MGNLTENGSEKDIVIADYREKQDVKLKKCPPGSRNGSLHENGHEDVQPQLNGVITARGGKITNLKYRLGQIQKAVLAFEKSSEVLIMCDEEIRRPDLLSLVQIHHAQCLLQGSMGDYTDETIELEEHDAILLRVKKSVHSDIKQSAVWNMLGLILLWTGLIEVSISLQLSEDSSKAEEVYKRALSLPSAQQAHAILFNLGNLYRHQKCFEHTKVVFEESLELCLGYAPAYNNLGLVYVAEGLWEEAKSCFQKAVEDTSRSNFIKAVAMQRNAHLRNQLKKRVSISFFCFLVRCSFYCYTLPLFFSYI